MSLEQILAQVKKNQSTQSPLPVINVLVQDKNRVNKLSDKLEILHVAYLK